MATLTVAEAARRLGVKQRTIRRYIDEHRLSTRTAAFTSGRRAEAGMPLLDADEVETLAQLRAYKNEHKQGVRAPQNPPAPSAPSQHDHPAVSPPSVEDDATSTVVMAGPAELPVAALVQSMLAPLIAELHDARETIRRQAEELGALRAIAARLEGHAAVAIAAPSDGQNGATHSAASGLSATAPVAGSAAPGPQSRRLLIPPAPLWRRAIAYWRRHRSAIRDQGPWHGP